MADSRGTLTEWPDGECPFVPAPGQVPPYLAGRESGQGLLRVQLGRLLKAARGSDVVIYGPRGNGKTALMERTLREAQAGSIGTMDFSADEIKSEEWLTRHVAILPRWLRALRGLSAIGFGIQTRDSAAGRISEALGRRARRRALVIAIDEAHTLAIDAGRALLNAVQRLRLKGLRVMLLLAGTPDLPRHLNLMDASFWNRSEILPLGLLQLDSAADAIRIPLEAEGRSIAEDALAQVVDESHGYPYFVQLWGRFLWEGMEDPARPTSLDDLDRARPRFENRRNIYYRDRHMELKRAELALVAARLALPFADTDMLTDLEVDETIRSALESEGRASNPAAVMTACDRLYDLGYIWSAGGESGHSFRPGIPSLMPYVARSSNIHAGSESE